MEHKQANNTNTASIIKTHKKISGTVVAISGTKTIKVKHIRHVRHPRYLKVIKKIKLYLVHDAKEECKVSDKVSIISCRPISKMKKFRLLSIIK